MNLRCTCVSLSTASHVRSVSFSEDAPRVKLIPGSAEQRGTNFVRALRGQTPFCRPLKSEGAYFLLAAEVDETSHDKLHLSLQVGILFLFFPALELRQSYKGPFRRPLKSVDADFLLMAEVDESSHNKLHSSLQLGE